MSRLAVCLPVSGQPTSVGCSTRSTRKSVASAPLSALETLSRCRCACVLLASQRALICRARCAQVRRPRDSGGELGILRVLRNGEHLDAALPHADRALPPRGVSLRWLLEGQRVQLLSVRSLD